jgi:hypothetical protein
VRCQCFQKNYPHRDRAGRDGRESIGLVIALRRVKLLYRVNNQGYGRPKGIFVTIITTEFEKPFADGHSVKHD